MQKISVVPHPVERSYKTPKAAIANAKGHPLQSQARNDARVLQGTHLTGARWTMAEFELAYSNGLHLHVFVSEQLVRWRLRSSPLLDKPDCQSIGAMPLLLDWGKIGVRSMDCSELMAGQIGAEFRNLWINEAGLYLYWCGRRFLSFHPIYRVDTGEDMLFVTNED